MPTLAIPYTLDRSKAAINQPIKFTFNAEGYPGVTNVKWTFPDGKVLEGVEVPRASPRPERSRLL